MSLLQMLFGVKKNKRCPNCKKEDVELNVKKKVKGETQFFCSKECSREFRKATKKADKKPFQSGPSLPW